MKWRYGINPDDPEYDRKLESRRAAARKYERAIRTGTWTRTMKLTEAQKKKARKARRDS